MAANLIADNLFTNFDQAGNQFTIIDSSTGTRTDSTHALQQDVFVYTSTRTKIRVNTNKLWYIYNQWKERSTTWNTVKNVKYLYLFQIDQFAVENRISEEPAFVWWAKYVLKKQDRIISKTQRFWGQEAQVRDQSTKNFKGYN